MISFSRLGNMGRCGNQLFQIAATISLALDNNSRYVFPYWFYESDFNLHGCFSNDISTANEYHEPFFHYQQITFKDNLNLVGYFQSDRYFHNNKDVILGLLTPKLGFSRKYDYTSIHVRRGDYVGMPRKYEQLNMNYYNQAMSLIKAKKYLVFSDDIEWCKKHFIGEQFDFVEGNSPTKDLSLMLSCANNIIANSSFSWWGAYLNKNPSKIVISPKRWFGPEMPHNTKDLIPQDWMIINA